VLSRNPRPSPWRVAAWDGVTPGDWVRELEGCDVCINLAGRSVNCRYNESNRRSIFESRIRSTMQLNQVIEALRQPPSLWINASTATIYRHSLDRPMDEATGELGGNEAGVPGTWKFSTDVAKAWEEAFFSVRTPRTRKIAVRSAIIMSPDRGGAFDVLLGLIRHGLGGRHGGGNQFVSWIHDADYARAIDFLITHEQLSGAVNIASPKPTQNTEFNRGLREAWGARIALSASKWMIEVGAFFMRTESELVLKSRYVLPGRLQAAGFRFLFPEWPAAAKDLISRLKEAESD